MLRTDWSYWRIVIWAAPAIALLAALLTVLSITPGQAQTTAQNRVGEFTLAETEFRDMLRGEKKYTYENWQDMTTRFISLSQKYLGTDTGAWSLYYVARALEERGQRFARPDDSKNAAEHYGRLAELYPKHSLADDGLYQRARIELLTLKNSAQARQDLTTLFQKYPDGDMRYRAEQLWTRLPDNPPLPGKGVATVEARPAAQQPAASTARPTAKPRPTVRTLMSISHQYTAGSAQVILELSEDIPYKSGFLAAKNKLPARLYIDLPGTVLDPSVSANIPVSDQVFKRIRAAHNPGSGVRVVMELQSNFKYSLQSSSDPPAVIVSLTTPGQTGSAARQTHVAPAQNTPARTGADPTVSRPQSGKAPNDLISQLGLSIQTIMIDAGHGGKDPGAKGLNKQIEKTVNLNVAKALGQALGRRGFKVEYTRSTDVFIALDKRTALANDKKADLFVSLHCNAFHTQKMNGFETYYLDQAKSAEAVRVAARENGVSSREISDLQVILTDLMLNSKIKESRSLAQTMNKQVASKLKSRYGLRDHGTKGAPFYVLMGAKMPAVLVEIGYITHPGDSQNMASNAFVQALAEALADGIVAYKGQVEKVATK